MHYYNGIDAAKRIGISYKTLLRHIEKGKLRPEEGKTPTGQLVISGDQVEAARLEVKQERDKFRRHETVLDKQSEPDIDSLISQVQSLEERVQDLESQLWMLTNALAQSHTVSPYDATLVQQSRQNRTTTTTSLPTGSLHSTEFADQLGLSKTVMEGMLKNGIRGEQLERVRVPLGKGKFGNYFTPEQQERAIALLKRHGRL